MVDHVKLWAFDPRMLTLAATRAMPGRRTKWVGEPGGLIYKLALILRS